MKLRGLTIYIPENITEISNDIFDDHNFISDVRLHNNVKKIKDWTFSYAFELKSIDLPDSLISIGEKAFSDSALQNITIPASVTEIGREAFRNCYDLCAHINGNPEVGEKVFSGIKQLVAPNMPLSKFTTSDNKKVAVRGFLENFELFKNAEICSEYKKYITTQKKTYLPLILEKDNIDLLSFFTDLKKVTAANFEKDFLIPAEEKNAINCIAFLLDWKNRNISAKDVEKEIKKELTKDPFNVADMKKIWNYKELPDGTLMLTKYKDNETEVFVPERIGKKAVTQLDSCIFSIYNPKGSEKPADRRNAIASITKINIPDSITTIGKGAFDGCKNLVSITLPDNVTSIGDFTFQRCENLASITLPDNVTSIGFQAFNGCKNLASITLPDNVTSIGAFTFQRCENLASITLPDSVTSIGVHAFDGCKNLRSIIIPDSVTSIGSKAFNCCENLTSITLPDNVTSIGFQAFNGCKNLASITLPDNVTSIGAFTFQRCENLASITLPDSVTSIGILAFDGCKNLTIYAPAGSYAEQYAKERNIPFVAEE